jgi:hypothetical protein
MQKGNFVDTKGVIGSRKSKDRQYNDQIQRFLRNILQLQGTI